jgi:HK97 family phage portal protein
MGFFNRISAWFERRATLKDTYGWFVEHLLGGTTTASGVSVGPEKALTLSAYFAAIRAISEDIGKIPLILYRRTGERRKERATTHPAYRLLHDVPNDDMSSMDFRSCLTAHACNWGNGYALIKRSTNLTPLALIPLEPSRMEISRNEEGRLFYRYRDEVGETFNLEQRDVFHLRGLGSNGIQGYSIARLARESLGQGLAEIKAGAAWFGNNSRPAGIIKMPGPDPGKEAKNRFREQWESRYKGPDRIGSTAILYGGADFVPLTMSNEDSQYIQSRQLTVEDMARWLRVPPHIIGHLLRSTFSNIAVQGVEYVTFCLLSWAVRWEKEIQRKLISPREHNVYAEHMFAGMLRGDIETRYRAYAIARQWGWKSANDILAHENENPIGPAGDVYLVPMNMANAESFLKTEEPETNELDGSGSDSGGGQTNSTSTSPQQTKEENARWLAMAERLLEERCSGGGNGHDRAIGRSGDDRCATIGDVDSSSDNGSD